MKPIFMYCSFYDSCVSPALSDALRHAELVHVEAAKFVPYPLSSVYVKPNVPTADQIYGWVKGKDYEVEWCKNNYIFYIKLNCITVASAIGSIEENYGYFIRSIYVEKEYREKGYGKLLLENIIKTVSENKWSNRVTSGISTGNEISLRMHKSCGFSPMGTFVQKVINEKREQ